MKKLLCSALILISTVSFAKVDAQYEKLKDTQFNCEVVSAVETRNGVVTKQSNEASIMENDEPSWWIRVYRCKMFFNFSNEWSR